MKYFLPILLIITCLGCKTDLKCVGDDEKISVFKNVNLKLKTENEFKAWAIERFDIDEAEYNNLIDDFINDLELKNGRKINANTDFNFCSCKSDLILSKNDSLTELFIKTGSVNQFTNLDFKQQQTIYKGLTKTSELNYDIQLTDDKDIYADVKTNILNSTGTFMELLQSYFLARKIQQKIYSSKEYCKEIKWGKNTFSGKFMIRDMTNPRRETTIPDEIVFELNQYIKLYSGDEYRGNIITNKIGILSENAKEKYSSYIGKDIIITVDLVKDDSGVISHPLELNVNEIVIE